MPYPFKTATCCCLLLLASIFSARGQEKPNSTAEVDVEIKKWVHLLADNKFSVRENAEKALRKKGLLAKKALRVAHKSEDPEMRQRAARLLNFIRIKEFEPAWITSMKTSWPKGLKAGKLSGPLLGIMDAGSAHGKTVNQNAALGRQKVQGGDRGLSWLGLAQDANGRFDTVRFGAQDQDDISQTSLALLSFLGAGHTEKVGRNKLFVQNAVAFLISRQNMDGAFIKKPRR